MITARLIKKTDNVNNLRCLKCLQSDSNTVIYSLRVLSSTNVDNHINISGTGILAGFYASRYNNNNNSHDNF